MSENRLSNPEAVATALEEIRERVRVRRARLSSEDAGSNVNLLELRKAVDELNDAWFVSAHLPVTWETPIVGRVGAYTKRIMRIMLRWYINPIVEQQNRFNSAATRAAVELNAYAELLTRRIGELEERIARLEGSEPLKRSGETEK
jgi:hypothetical protein